MKLIVLAAGNGTRMGGGAKGLIPLSNGEVMLDHHIRHLAPFVDETFIVTGAWRGSYEERYGDQYNYIFNPVWAAASNLFSVWIALKAVEGAFILSNCDIVASRSLVERLVAKAFEIGEASLVMDGAQETRQAYGGMSVVVSADAIERVRARVEELIVTMAKPGGRLDDKGHWDVFCLPDEKFGERAVLYEDRRELAEVDTWSDMALMYRDILDGKTEVLND